MDIPRSEYPRPQFARLDWLCLNGEWQFEIDNSDSGLERGLLNRELTRRIVVPFCPESSLSGIGETDYMNVVWYRRKVEIPASWAGRRVLLHFQAVDYDATVWVNGVEVGRHRGGFTPFTCDITDVASPGGEATIVVRARDDAHQPQPRGKQSQRFENYSFLYTRTTGIWQTVWMEPVPDCALLRPRITPDVANGIVRLELPLTRNRRDFSLRATLRDDKGIVCSTQCAADLDMSPRLDLPVPASRRRLWSPGDPHLYELEIELLDSDGRTSDRATSYAGLRGVAIDGKAIRINGQVIFQRLVLDQGYYPDGIMTAPTDEALRRDIEISMAAGFNGARLHQKVFEERFLYHADRLGYLVWGEFPDFGSMVHATSEETQQQAVTLITQWEEALQRDYSHPCIIGWCGLNETGPLISDRIRTLDDVTRGMFLAAKSDGTRPVLDASGYSHRVPESDVFDSHDYEQEPEKLKQHHAGLSAGKAFRNGPSDKPWSIPYRGQPYFVSEFGGIWWNPEPPSNGHSWGYGRRPHTTEEFYTRFEGLSSVLLDNPDMFGYCYTQLTDIYQEQNGIYRFDRRPKFDIERIRRAQQRPAAIEQRRAATARRGK